MEDKNSAPLDHMKQLDQALDEYEVGIGLSPYRESAVDDTVKRYLNMPRQQMEKLSIEDCAQAALLLGGFAFHVQRSYNRELARVNWAEGVLKNMISGKENQYQGSWDSQYHQAVKEDKYAEGVLKLKKYAKQRADRLNFLSTSIKNLSDLFLNLQKSKIMK